MTESLWLRRLIREALTRTGSAEEVRKLHGPVSGIRPAMAATSTCHVGGRLYVRMRPDDLLLLRERAAARGMAAATYVSLLVRSHLRNLVPLPTQEYTAVKELAVQLRAMGRNLNQLARIANQTGDTQLSSSSVMSMLKLCEGTRDHVKALILANTNSWRAGSA